MKSYAKVKGEKELNWFKELSKLPTLERADELSDLSANWVTCACGNQCSIIPRNEDDQPIDPKLKELGNDFHHSGVLEMFDQLRIYSDTIKADNARKNAIKILKKIEKRSVYLIQQEVKKAQKLLETVGVIKKRKNATKK